jgi:cobalt-zinc-cadmium resistance protein CzcA
VGLIALFGIALGIGTVLTSYKEAYARSGRLLDQVAIDAAGLRAPAVLMATLTPVCHRRCSNQAGWPYWSPGSEP